MLSVLAQVTKPVSGGAGIQNKSLAAELDI